MYESFAAFFTALWQADFGFVQLWDWLVGVYKYTIYMPGVLEIRTAIDSFVAPALPYLPFILIALSILIALVGKKILPVLKFLTFFFFGFIGCAFFITPILANLIAMPSWLCGLVIAIVAAVLYRFVYYVLYTLFFLYSTYIICYTGFTLQPQTEHSESKALTCLAVAVAVVIVAFIFKKYVEMAMTSFLGGYFVFLIINGMLFNFASIEFFSYTPWVMPLVITLVIAIPGFVVQFKSRKRYY